jgi:predicted nucleic acid-binding protein
VEEKVVNREVEAHTPDLLLYEVSFVMLKAVMKNVLNLYEAIKAISALEAIGITINNLSWMDFKEILKIASSAKISIYDAAYIYLSMKKNAILVTPDEEIKNKGGDLTEIHLLKDMPGLFRDSRYRGAHQAAA